MASMGIRLPQEAETAKELSLWAVRRRRRRRAFARCIGAPPGPPLLPNLPAGSLGPSECLGEERQSEAGSVPALVGGSPSAEGITAAEVDHDATGCDENPARSHEPYLADTILHPPLGDMHTQLDGLTRCLEDAELRLCDAVREEATAALSTLASLQAEHMSSPPRPPLETHHHTRTAKPPTQMQTQTQPQAQAQTRIHTGS